MLDATFVVLFSIDVVLATLVVLGYLYERTFHPERLERFEALHPVLAITTRIAVSTIAGLFIGMLLRRFFW